MSIKLMQRARVLVVGVALIALTLAMAPGVANAKTDVGGKVDAALKGGERSGGGGGADKSDGNGGSDAGANKVEGKVDAALRGGDGDRANLDGKVDGAIKGDARSNLLGDTNLNTDTNTDQRVDLNDPPLVGGDTKSINEVNSDFVPANGEAKADANIVVDGLLDEGLCVRGALNQNASGCGGGAAGGGDGNGDGITTATPAIDINANEILGDTTLDSATNTDQRVDLNDSPLVDGDTTTINEVNSELVPARGNANVDALAEVDGLLREEVCGRNALNQDASGCGGSGGAANSDDNNGIDLLGEPLADLDETTVDSTSDIIQNLDPNNTPTLDGAINNRNDLNAPAVPASGTVKVDGNGALGDTLEQSVNSCTDVNASGCNGAGGNGTGNGNNIDLGDPLADLEDISVDSTTDIAETLGPNGPTLNGGVENGNDIEVPLPVSGTVEGDADVNVPGLLEQSVNSCTDVNASGCGGANTASSPGSSGPDGIHLNDATVDSVTDIEENLDPNNTPVLNGTVDNTNNIIAPAVPASAKAEFDANVNAPGLLEQDLSSCTTLNAGPCGANTTAPPGAGGSGDGDPGDGGSGDGSSGGGSGNGGSGTGDGGPGGGGSDSESSEGNNDSGFGSGFPLLGRSLERLSDDSFDELASAAPADSTDSSDDSGSSGSSGSANNDRAEPASAANPFERGSQSLAANPSTSDSRFVALSAGSSGNQDKASASSGSKTNSGELPDTGGITPLVLVAGLLFISSGILLVTKRRRRFDS